MIKQIITIIHKIVSLIFSFQQLLIFLGWELDPYKWSWSGFLDWLDMLLLHLKNWWTKTPSSLDPCDMVMWGKNQSFTGDIHGKVAWRIIPLSRWSMTTVNESPKWGCSPFKWPKWLIKGVTNHFLTGMILQVHVRYGDLKDEFLQNLTWAVKDFRKSHTEKEQSGANSNNSYPRHPTILLEYEGKKNP